MKIHYICKEIRNMRKNRTIFFILIILLTAFGRMARLSAATTTNTKDKFTLVIDAGHGGKDPGAIGRFSREKNINLAVSKAFGELVESNCPDVKVVYTRKSDVFVPLDRRADIANKANANLFISIHTNALPGKTIARGAETYTLGMARAQANLDVAKRENAVILVENDYKERYQGFNPNSAESYIMFEFMQDKYMEQSVNLAKLIQKEFRTTGGRPDKGVHQAGFLVLRQTSMPSVLVELGYISTHDEEAFLNSQNGIRKMSRSLYNAFIEYKRKHSPKETNNTPATSAQRNQAITSVDTLEAASTTAKASNEDEQKKQSAQSEIASLIQETRQDPSSLSTTEKHVKDGSKTKSAAEEQPVFKIQLLVSTRQLHTGSTQFKGLAPVDFYKEGNYYKYTYGATTDYQEIVKTKNKIATRFKGAFIIAFKQGKKMELKQAISEYKKNK